MAKFIPYQSKKAFLEPTQETINAIEQAIQWSSVYVPKQLRFEMDRLVFYMALVNQGFARKMSFGPSDPRETNVRHQATGRIFIGSESGPPRAQTTWKRISPLAWKIPVRRITGRYYLGWKVRKLKPAVWQLYNDSREAYFIEFGIHTSLRRVRRPIRKLSLRKTMDFMMATNAWHRIWVDIYANPKYEHKGRGFTQFVSGPGKGGLTGQLHGAKVTFISPHMMGRKM